MKPEIQHELNQIEVFGLIAMFNLFYGQYLKSKGLGQPLGQFNFSYCDQSLCSDDYESNPLLFEGYRIKCLFKGLAVDFTYLCLVDEHENESLCHFDLYSGEWEILDTNKRGKTF